MKRRYTPQKKAKLVCEYQSSGDAISYQLDFPYELEERYPKACRENREYAKLIYDRLLDDGIYAGEKLSDEEFYELIKRKYNEVLDIAAGGFQ